MVSKTYTKDTGDRIMTLIDTRYRWISKDIVYPIKKVTKEDKIHVAFSFFFFFFVSLIMIF